jgi:hypothetical protein
MPGIVHTDWSPSDSTSASLAQKKCAKSVCKTNKAGKETQVHSKYKERKSQELPYFTFLEQFPMVKPSMRQDPIQPPGDRSEMLDRAGRDLQAT